VGEDCEAADQADRNSTGGLCPGAMEVIRIDAAVAVAAAAAVVGAEEVGV